MASLTLVETTNKKTEEYPYLPVPEWQASPVGGAGYSSSVETTSSPCPSASGTPGTCSRCLVSSLGRGQGERGFHLEENIVTLCEHLRCSTAALNCGAANSTINGGMTTALPERDGLANRDQVRSFPAVSGPAIGHNHLKPVATPKGVATNNIDLGSTD